MNTATPVIENDVIGVHRLRSFWQRQLAARNGGQANATIGKFDRILIDGLGLPIELTTSYLMQYAPTFAEFERWIIENNDGYIDPLRIERINCATEGTPYSEALQNSLCVIDEMEAVLPDEDIEFWEEHGYVILRNAISTAAAHAAEDAVWEYLKMDRDDPQTWYANKIGKHIMTDLYYHPALNANRRSLRIHKAFAQLWRTSDLWRTTDRAGFNPPETRHWKFPGPDLHWDMNLAPPFQFHVQGILYLCDTAADQGAFTCVPGFHKRLENWLAELPEGIDPREVDLRSQAKPIAANAGDMVLWHQFLPHGSSPNTNVCPRIVQYISMYPALNVSQADWI